MVYGCLSVQSDNHLVKIKRGKRKVKRKGQEKGLKQQSHKIFDLQFFHHSIPSVLQMNRPKSF